MMISVTKKGLKKIKKHRKATVFNDSSINETLVGHLKAEDSLSNWYANILETDVGEVIVYYNDFTGMMLVSAINEQTRMNSL